MAKKKTITVDKELNKKCDQFIKKIKSDMKYNSTLSSDLMQFDWLDEFELACPYIDNIVRSPKVALIKEEDIVKIEKAKKISVSSVKDLSKNTHYIETIHEQTGDVQPSKILIERSEETFNTYENRFIYTLIYNLTRFVTKQEDLLENFGIENSKILEYAARTSTKNEKINIELKINSLEILNNSEDKSFLKELENIKTRIKRIKGFIASWARSEMITALVKADVPLVSPPIKKTNLILKNPNFQMANRLWDFLQMYEIDVSGAKDAIDTSGDDILKGVLNDAFLMNYFILDSITSSKRAQKEKLYNYAIVMMHQQIKRVISILLEKGINITDQEIFDVIADEIKNERTNNGPDNNEVKKKFQSAVDDYLKKSQNFL